MHYQLDPPVATNARVAVLVAAKVVNDLVQTVVGVGVLMVAMEHVADPAQADVAETVKVTARGIVWVVVFNRAKGDVRNPA